MNPGANGLTPFETLTTMGVGDAARFASAGRALHLVDIENLMGGPFAGFDAMAAAGDAYRVAASVQPGDHVIVAANPGLAFEVNDVWPGARMLLGFGSNGADLALIDAIADVAWVSRRYDRLVIGSGDGIFTFVADAYRVAGIPVHVVCRPTSLSRALDRAASTVRFMDPCARIVAA